MDYRQKNFIDKFTEAGNHLQTAPEQIISLKIKQNVAGYHEYHDLLRELQNGARIQSKEILGNFQGKAYLIKNSRTKVILVEHETGLEILYVAGSVASLLGLIPLVLRGWDSVHSRFSHGHHRPTEFQSIETRRIGAGGKLIETKCDAWAEPLSVMNTTLLSAAEIIDSDILELKNTVNSLSDRVKLLEDSNEIPRKPASKKKTKRKPRR